MEWVGVDEVILPLLLILGISEVEPDFSVAAVDCDVDVAVPSVFTLSLDCCFVSDAPVCTAFAAIALPDHLSGCVSKGNLQDIYLFCIVLTIKSYTQIMPLERIQLL